MAAIRGSEIEKRALFALFGQKRMCVLSRTDQAANLISDLWPEHRDALLAAVASRTL